MLSMMTLTLAALAAGTSFLTPGTYQYTALLNGQPAATSKITVTRTGNATDIDEDSAGSLAGMRLSGKATLVLGADLAPMQYNGNYESAAQKATVTVALTPTSATIAGSAATGGSQLLALSANTRHFVVIEPGLLAGLFALPAQLESWKDPAVTAIAPMSGHAEALSTDPASAAARPTDVPAQDAVLSFGGQFPFTIWYDPTTFVPDEVIVPMQHVVITRARAAPAGSAPPQY
jgi:hypothetical protein